MKKLFVLFMAAFLLMLFVPFEADASTAEKKDPVTTSETIRPAEVDALLVRLEEIKSMDIDELSFAEKRALRKEVRTIKNDIKEIESGGAYISVGAAIIIILLLILLL